MNNEEKKNIFLQYLARIYIQNPTLAISRDTIYSELSSFNISRGKQTRLPRTNLVPVQIVLGKDFPNNSWSNGSFWLFENRKRNNDRSFIKKLGSGIKLYISIDENKIYQQAKCLFQFMLKENILVQGKVSKILRNDALVVRVETKEDALKVIDYVNNLKYLDNEKKSIYEPKICPNPFTFNAGKVNITMDGKLSYNGVLSSLIYEYLQEKRNDNLLNSVSINDFKLFLNKIWTDINFLNNLIFKYSRGNSKDFVMILKLINKNLDNSLSIDEVLNFQKNDGIEEKQFEEKIDGYSVEEKQIVISIIAKLEEKYNLEEAHLRLLNYFEKGNINVFTRDYNIRKTVAENFPPEKLKGIVSEIGFNTLIDASKDTVNKYGYSQLEYAVKILLNEMEGKKRLEGFTNRNNMRSRLGFVIPEKLLMEIIETKVLESGREFNSGTVCELLCEYIEEKDRVKSGRN